MTRLIQSKTQKHSNNFHGAAVIDEKGREVPITEDMVQKACQSLQNEAKPQH